MTVKIDALLAALPGLELAEQRDLLLLFADAHTLFPEITFEMFVSRVAAVAQRCDDASSLLQFGSYTLTQHKKLIQVNRLSAKTEKQLVTDYIASVDRLPPGTGFSWAAFLEMQRTAPTTSPTTPSAPGLFDGLGQPATSQPEPAVVATSTGLITGEAAGSPVAAAKPARRRAAATATTSAGLVGGVGTRCEFQRNNGPVLQGSIIQLAEGSPGRWFQSDDGEAIFAQPTELRPSVTPTPPDRVPTEYYALVIPADQLAYGHSVLEARQPLDRTEMGAIIRVYQGDLGVGLQAQLTLTNEAPPYLDPYVMAVPATEGPVAELPPREYSVLGYYQWVIGTRIIRLNVTTT